MFKKIGSGNLFCVIYKDFKAHDAVTKKTINAELDNMI